MLKFTNSNLLALLLVCFTAVMFTACDNDDDGADAYSADLFFLNLAPNTSEVDFVVNDNVEANDLDFKESKDYVNIDLLPDSPESFDINIEEGTSLSFTSAISADEDYSVILVGDVGNYNTLILNDDLSVPAEDKAHVRFLYASPNGTAIDVVDSNGNILVSSMTYNPNDAVASNMFTGFTEVDAGDYDLEVRLAGTSQVLEVEDGANFDSQNIYTVVIAGYSDVASGDDELDIFVIENADH